MNVVPESAVNSSSLPTAGPLILFDGVCGLCNGWVSFVLRFDRAGHFRFTPLQSETGRRVLERFRLPVEYLDSILLLNEGQVYTGSAAVLRILKGLGLPFSFLYVFTVIPRPIRETVYNFIARNRYNWFGRTETCRIPTPAERGRFV